MNEKYPYECAIVIPTYNEAGNIVDLVTAIEQTLSGRRFQIIVVDDHSPDRTADILNEYAATKEHIKAVLNENPRGLSPSIVFGFGLAEAPILCCMDGDGQHLPEALIPLLEKLKHTDFVFGSRYCKDGGFVEKWNPVRVFVSRSAAWLTAVMIKVKVSDPMSGFFGIRKELFEQLRPYLAPKGFKIMLELLFFVRLRTDKNVDESPLVFAMRRKGRSKLSLAVIGDFLNMLMRLRRILKSTRDV